MTQLKLLQDLLGRMHDAEDVVQDTFVEALSDVPPKPAAMEQILAELSKHPVKTRVSLTGPLIVARDIAHAKIKERLDAGEPMPEYLREMCVYYAGPAKTPDGYASGSFGPTTAGRMDSYVDQFQAAGGSFVILMSEMTAPPFCAKPVWSRPITCLPSSRAALAMVATTVTEPVSAWTKGLPEVG